MEVRFAHNYNRRHQQQHALIELVIMQQQLMAPQQHMHQHLPAKLIYQHVTGMVIQDVQAEAALHISVLQLHVKQLLPQVNLVGNSQQSMWQLHHVY